ncbi:MAG: TonB-dependent receptor plug domain-containing protein, partial [Pseudomonadota bacterium]
MIKFFATQLLLASTASIFMLPQTLCAEPVSATEPVSEKETVVDQSKARAISGPKPAAKQVAIPQTASTEDISVLPEVKINEKRFKDERINKTQSITTISSQDLDRSQPSSIFDAVRDVPGVSIDGGPRLTGMSFNIRGFSDNEDVAVKVDGVQKNFEKYRMSGTFIEPELIKTIEVQRGPQIASGSGSLGGTILATTKDAADLLARGQSVGARLKFGYGNNSDEYTRSYLAYARPHERVDILYNYTNRNSNDIMQGDGEHLQYSAVASVSQLLKFSLFPIDSLQLTTSVVKYEQGKTIQLYDSISEFNAQFGYVLRAIDELTIAENITFKPDTPWINLKATLGKGHTENDETNPFGWPRNTLSNSANFYCDGFIRRRRSDNVASSAEVSASNCRGDRYEIYKFANTTVDIANTARIYEAGDLSLRVLTGYQYLEQKRTVALDFQNPASLAVFAGYIPVSGIKTTRAAYIQPRLDWKGLSIIPGFRQD